jgi:hypothetical protein
MNFEAPQERLLLVPAKVEAGRISADAPLDDVGRLVAEGNIVVLNGAFRAMDEQLVAARRGAWAWALETEPLDQPDPATNCHCQQVGVSRFQKTPHLYHSYNFNKLRELPEDLSELLRGLYAVLATLHRDLTGYPFASVDEVDDEGRSYHPQMIQYPKGGGLFGRHVHGLDPQRIGMITSLTQVGTDFETGGTGFAPDGVEVDTEGHHDLGDIVLFRYDVPHWVSPAPTRHDFDWNSDEGRWTMVLPYH